ncbi:hypothetical protein LCGC14_2695280 [marine sediment metagenome]|uniref:Uncharacterized protein n=1 Tax=marine sediment metagenome TaxID=412755 RepID=A0A0F8ZHE2_9ZZZZ
MKTEPVEMPTLSGEKLKIPKDLGLKIGSPKEVMWTSVLNTSKEALDLAEETILIQKELIILAGRKIKEEQRKG